MNPFASRINNQSWVIPVSLVSLPLGFMIALAWVTKDNRTSRSAFLSPDQRTRINEGEVNLDAYLQATSEVKKLQDEKTRMEFAMSKKGDDTKVLNENLQETKVFAGLTDLEGPGVVVTLSDSKKQSDISFGNQVATNPESVVHDTDVVHTVNELYASGAEAIAINGHRVAGTTSVRCVGTTVLVNDVKIASPIAVRAIGDPDTLYGAMNMPGGALSQIRQFDPGMVQIEKVKMMRLPAYVGPTTRKWAHVPAPDKSGATADAKQETASGT